MSVHTRIQTINKQLSSTKNKGMKRNTSNERITDICYEQHVSSVIERSPSSQSLSEMSSSHDHALSDSGHIERSESYQSLSGFDNSIDIIYRNVPHMTKMITRIQDLQLAHDFVYSANNASPWVSLVMLLCSIRDNELVFKERSMFVLSMMCVFINIKDHS
jgi:hypothetical protein